jgi:hypothetical protein
MGDVLTYRASQYTSKTIKSSFGSLLRYGRSSVPLKRVKCRAGEKKMQIVATSIAPRCDMARSKNLTH